MVRTETQLEEMKMGMGRMERMEVMEVMEMDIAFLTSHPYRDFG